MAPSFDMEVVRSCDIFDIDFVKLESSFKSSVVFEQSSFYFFLCFEFYMGSVIERFATENIDSH